MLEWHRLAANRKVRRMAASIPNTAPVVHFTPSRSRYQFILLGEQRHMCVNNLLRVAPSGGTAGNRTRDLSITNPPYHYTTKPHVDTSRHNAGDRRANVGHELILVLPVVATSLLGLVGPSMLLVKP